MITQPDIQSLYITLTEQECKTVQNITDYSISIAMGLKKEHKDQFTAVNIFGRKPIAHENKYHVFVFVDTSKLPLVKLCGWKYSRELDSIELRSMGDAFLLGAFWPSQRSKFDYELEPVNNSTHDHDKHSKEHVLQRDRQSKTERSPGDTRQGYSQLNFQGFSS